MATKFKQKCSKCKKNYVVVTNRTRYAICYDCQKEQLKGEIKDPEMKKMFDIPEEFYKENSFLRDIKIKYLQWGELTENQINAFKRVVQDLKDQSEKES
ncbi:hypothetical protein KY330_03700 [Candidatus Woesearchaeota archaeon]|nr:hypothetical protein [Candidatus Woesearchaeota archaeon]